jgi:hypothetical protein
MAKSSSTQTVVLVVLLVLLVLIVVALGVHLMGGSPFGWLDGIKAMHGRG